VDGSIFLACPRDELPFVARGAVVTFSSGILFNNDLQPNPAELFYILEISADIFKISNEKLSEAPSLQRSENFLTKNPYSASLRAFAVQSPSPTLQECLKVGTAPTT
jgi:hypothetical protein